MAVKEVVQHPAQILHKKAEEVVDFESEDLDKIIKDMKDTLYEEDGVGLAAPQIGVARRIFVLPEEYAPMVRTFRAPFSLIKPFKATVFINPEITEYSSEKREMEEGCLSVRGVFHPTTRSYAIELSSQTRKGKKFNVKVEGLLARIFQHETDHLNGVLFLDRLHEK